MSASPQSTPSPKIMIVEDEGILAMDIENRLKRLGYHVVALAASGEEALSKASVTQPDLVLMDVMLQGEVDGIATAQVLRGRYNIPIIYLTAYADEQTLSRAKLTEPFGYLIKPFKERELRTSIEVALYKHTMERKLREREQWLATTLRSIGDAVIATDKHGLVVLMNPVAEVLTGWHLEEAQGRYLGEIFRIVNEQTRITVESPVEKVMRHEKVVGLANHTVLISKDGGEYAIDDCAAPILTENGDIDGIVLVFRDVTERKEAEELARKKDELLIKAQRMESIGRLAGGIAHDFNNMLTVIIGFSSLALPHLQDKPETQENVRIVLQTAEKAAALTRQLLAFSRNQILKPVVMNLNQIIEGMDKILRRLVGERVELVIRLATSLRDIKADPAQFEQVVMNLALNAYDAMPDGGTLLIETRNIDILESEETEHAGLPAGQYAMLMVSDTGIGMEKGVLDKIFEPFFTTKEIGKGTGLGLATVYGIVKQSQGEIFVSSEPGAGSTFKLYLPKAPPPTSERPAVESAAATNAGTETILIVDDNEPLRNLLRTFLGELGYTILPAASSEEALRLAANHTTEIALLLSDIGMPKMKGTELAERLKQQYPNLKVIFMSGYSEDVMMSGELQDPDSLFVQKPFSPMTMAAHIRHLLDDK